MFQQLFDGPKPWHQDIQRQGLEANGSVLTTDDVLLRWRKLMKKIKASKKTPRPLTMTKTARSHHSFGPKKVGWMEDIISGCTSVFVSKIKGRVFWDYSASLGGWALPSGTALSGRWSRRSGLSCATWAAKKTTVFADRLAWWGQKAFSGCCGGLDSNLKNRFPFFFETFWVFARATVTDSPLRWGTQKKSGQNSQVLGLGRTLVGVREGDLSIRYTGPSLFSSS